MKPRYKQKQTAKYVRSLFFCTLLLPQSVYFDQYRAMIRTKHIA